MSDDIDVLGSSLLNRQRITRKRTEKRLRRDTRNQAILNVGATGVRLVNKYLEERARNFVDNNEELAGQRVLFAKALKNKTRLLDEYDKAQADPAGEEHWLAQNKFAPIIKNNLESTFNTQGYSTRDINNYINEQALIEAKKYIGTWRNSVDEAFKLGTQDDYDAYIKANDGQAENVGGLLFNRITRSLNNKTQEDVDSEILESLKNNRFADSARELARFQRSLNAGLTVAQSKDLAYKGGSDTGFTNRGTRPERIKDLTELGINKADMVLTEVDPTTVEWYSGGRGYATPVNKMTYFDGVTKKVVYAPLQIEDVNGQLRIAQPQAWNSFTNSRQGQALNTSSNLGPDDPIKENSLESYIDVGLENGTLIEDPERKGPEVTQTKWNQKGTIYYTDIYRNEPGAKEKGTPIYTRSRVVYDEELTPDIKFRNMTEDKTQEGVTALQEIAGILKIPGGETGTVAEVDLLNRWWAGTEDNYETLKDDGDLDDIFASQRDVAGKYIYLRADEFEEKYGLNHNDALRLAAATEMTDLVFGWNRKAEIVNLSATAISPNDHPATAMLIANNLLDASQGGRYEGLEESALGAAVIDSFNEIADQYKNDPDRGQALADIILQNETLSEIRIPTNGFEDPSIPEKIKAAIGINPEADSLSIAEIFSYAGGKPVIEEVPTPPEDGSSIPTSDPNRTLTDVKTSIDNMTEPSPVAQKIHNTIVNFLTSNTSRFGKLSETRPESTATTQDFLALLSEEEQEEFNRLVNSPK
jgi:hypothetical protein